MKMGPVMWDFSPSRDLCLDVNLHYTCVMLSYAMPALPSGLVCIASGLVCMHYSKCIACLQRSGISQLQHQI